MSAGGDSFYTYRETAFCTAGCLDCRMLIILLSQIKSGPVLNHGSSIEVLLNWLAMRAGILGSAH